MVFAVRVENKKSGMDVELPKEFKEMESSTMKQLLLMRVYVELVGLLPRYAYLCQYFIYF